MSFNKSDILDDINNYLSNCGYNPISPLHPILSDHFCNKFYDEIMDNVSYHGYTKNSPEIQEVKDLLIDRYVLPKLGLKRRYSNNIEVFDDLSEWFPDEPKNQNGKMKMTLDIGAMFGDNSGKIDIFSN